MTLLAQTELSQALARMRSGPGWRVESGKREVGGRTLRAGPLLEQPVAGLVGVELLLGVDSDERCGEGEVGGAVDECVSVEDDRRRRGRRALLALRAGPVDGGRDRSGRGPVGVDGNRVQPAAVVAHVGKRAAGTDVLQVRVELRQRRLCKAPTERAVRTLATKPTLRG